MAAHHGGPADGERPEQRFFQAIGRLEDGATPAEVAARLQPLGAQWAHDYPKDSVDRGFNVMPLHKAAMDSTGTVIVWLLQGLAGAVLLIACANLANLQLARATAGAKDLAIRTALGASRGRLIVHQLTECLILAFGGGLAGLLVAAWVNRVLGNAIRIDNSAALSLPLDGRVLAVSFLVSLVAGLAFGLLPAWLASRQDVVTTLKAQARGSTSGRGQRLARRGLIVAEVAIALALLAVAGVMIRGFGAMLHKDAGWDTAHLLVANIHLPEQSTYDTEDKRRLAIERLEQRLAAIPGAEATAVCTTPPYFGYSRTGPIQVEGQTPDDPAQQPLAGYVMVGPGFFATLGIPLREGRLFTADLRAESPPVVVIGESLARKFWPNESALGKRIGDREKGVVVWREVIGVVRDIAFPLNLANPVTVLQIYKPLVQEPWGYLHLLVRGKAPASFKNDVRRAVADLDPDVAVQETFTIPEASARYQHNIVVINNVLGAFALLGLALAAVGLYGVISNLVAHRTAEFGIRLALGAAPRDVLGLVLGGGIRLTLAGLAVGAGLAYALIRLLGSEMPRMATADPLTLAGVVAVLFAVALFACYWPARRATRVDPLVALRAE